jgi:hypothetical protein
MSNFEFEIIGIGSESEVGIQSVKARITKVVSDSNEEEKQGSKDTDKNA